jgi:hypothetical protein
MARRRPHGSKNRRTRLSSAGRSRECAGSTVAIVGGVDGSSPSEGTRKSPVCGRVIHPGSELPMERTEAFTGMERLWSPAVATSGNQRQTGCPRKTGKIGEIRCRGLPPVATTPKW